MTNAMLGTLLNMKATRFRPTETSTGTFGVTTQTFSASTGLPIHVQPLDADETTSGYGYEQVGTMYQGFAQVDADYAVNDIVRLESIGGSTSVTMVGYPFVVRGKPDQSVWPGIDHQLLSLEYRPEWSS